MDRETAIEIVRKLIKSGVYLYVDGSELKYRSPKGAFTNAFKHQVKEYKESIVNYLLEIKENSSIQNHGLPAIEPRQDSTNLPLSFAQQRLWFVDQLGQGSIQYNTQNAFILNGPLNDAAFELALRRLIERHEVLRTSFSHLNGEAYQVISTQFRVPLVIHDFSEIDEINKNLRINELMRREAKVPFDLSKDLMVRVCVVTLSKSAHLVFYTLHHIAGDGWSMTIFENELKLLYQSIIEDKPASLATFNIQYADYALWQRDWLKGEFLEQQLSYWRRNLADIPLVHNLPLDKIRPAQQSYAGKMYQQIISAEVTSHIRQICKNYDVTLFMFLQTAFAVLLSRYSNEKDIVMGAAVAGRNHGDLENLIGLFLNILVIRTDLSEEKNFLDLLLQNKENILLAYEHQSVPFEMLVEELCPDRDLSHNSIVQILFGVQNNELANTGNDLSNDLTQTSRDSREDPSLEMSTRFDLKLDVYEGKNELTLAWLYNVSLFEDKSIRRLAKSFQSLLISIIASVEDPTYAKKSVHSLSILSNEDSSKLLKTWNTNHIRFEQESCFHEIFQEQVLKVPNAVALKDEDNTLSYSQLNRKANRLAHYLTDLPIGTGCLVGLFFERSCDMVVALLGVLKAGGAYLPIDPGYPKDRVSYMITDSKVKVILTQSKLYDELPNNECRVVSLDSKETQNKLAILPESDLNPSLVSLTNNQLAYVIYTSGSTGKPKGVLVNHKALCDFLYHAANEFLPEHVQGAIVSSPLVFDATIGSLLVPLIAGKFAELIPQGVFALDHLGDCLTDDESSLLFKVTPSHLEALMSKGFMQKNEQAKHVIVVAGEALSTATLKYWRENLLPNSLFINEYGPTESTVGSTIFPVRNSYSLNDNITVPIGRRLGDTQLYVLNDSLVPQNIGAAGELYIGGVGLAQGYLDRPSLTAMKFIPNSFTDVPGERLYKTGDLTRYLPDGNMSFIGRIDHQVKLRGYRIELGEIESTLLELMDVEDVTVQVVYADNHDKQLVAYVVNMEVNSQKSESPSLEVLQNQITSKYITLLKKQLPAYMVPQCFIFLNEIPLTTNGKVDTKALPKPSNGSRISGGYVAPTNELEKKLAQLWQELLDVKQVGIEDNFFNLGGHSLLATRLVSMIRHELEVELSLTSLFESPTISGLAKELKAQNNKVVLPAINVAERNGKLPLSYAQQRLWFLDRLGEGSIQYNMPSLFNLPGKFDKAAFRKALYSLIQRHEVLRTHFKETSGNPSQIIKSEFRLPYSLVDLSSLTKQEQTNKLEELVLEEYATPFDLSGDLMIRAKSILLSQDECVVLYTLHHIAGDGWSTGILQRELSTIYNAYKHGLENPLQPLNIQYVDYAVWQRNWLKGEILEKQLSYWRKSLSGIPLVHSLPLDKVRPSQQKFEGKVFHQYISSAVQQELGRLCKKYNVTLFMLLQTIFAILLGRYSNQNDIVMGSPIAGRTHRDIENLIGFFVNTLVLRTQFSGNQSFEELLISNKNIILNAYANQHVPFEMLVEHLKPERSLSHNPIVQVQFVVQNYARTAESELIDFPVKKNPNFNGQSETDRPISQSNNTEHNVKDDLFLCVQESQQGLLLSWVYNTDLFEASSIVQLSESFEVLLSDIISTPDKKIDQLKLISVEKNSAMIKCGFGEDIRIDDALSFHQLFEHYAALLPNNRAVLFENEALTYNELNQKANQLAHFLIEKNVTSDSLVGIILERSLEMTIAILGILKSGAAYVPLDPNNPQKRNATITKESGCELILTSSLFKRNFSFENLKTIIVNDVDFMNSLTNYPTDNPSENRVGISGLNLAYVIYTSGSTGRPKGVQVTHRNLIHYLNFVVDKYFPNRFGSVVSTSLSFDATVTSILGPLACGKYVKLLSIQNGTEQLTNCLFSSEEPLVFKLTPSHLELVKQLVQPNTVSTLEHTLIVGGEQLTNKLLTSFQSKLLPNAHIFNEYGPTETTVGCSTYYASKSKILNSSIAVPIGQSISNCQTYVVDPQFSILPKGAIGELLIGGEGVSRGYLKQPGLTAKKFIPDPFSKVPGRRVYRSGDEVRLLNSESKESFVLEFQGRADQQIKIQGMRIELGEIKSQLSSIEDIQDCFIACCNNGLKGKQLVAYIKVMKVVSLEQENGLRNDYRDYLSKVLPDYMVPKIFIFLPEFPLTINGKIDQEALPIPDDNDLLTSIYVEPTTSIQSRLCELWKNLLKMKNVGIRDNFFLIGGHSLLGIQLISLIRAEFKVELPLRTLFTNPTVESLAVLLGSESGRPVIPSIEFVDRKNRLRLSHAQHRLWFIDQLEPGDTRYNMVNGFMLHSMFDEIAFENALNTLLERHEVLRSNFESKDNDVYQIIRQVYKLPLVFYDLSEFSEQQKNLETERVIKSEINTSFDLSRDLMIRVNIIRLSKDISFVVYNMHHIASDGWSMNIFRRELNALYNAFVEGKDNPLEPLKIQYADYANWQRKHLSGEVLEKALGYWTRQLEGVPLVHSLPLDHVRPRKQRYMGSTYCSHLDKDLFCKVKKLNQEQNVTMFMFLHAALSLLISRYSGATDIVIATSNSGRTQSELEGLIGLFINDLVLRMKVPDDASFLVLLNEHKQNILDAFEHQAIPFELLVEELNPPRSLSHGPIFQIKLDLHTEHKQYDSLASLQQEYPIVEKRSISGQIDFEHTVKHDLYISITETDSNLSINWRYDSDLFSCSTIERLAGYYVNLISSIVKSPVTQVQQLDFLSNKERKNLTSALGLGAKTSYSDGRCIHELFEEQVAKTPTNIAIIYKNEEFTYLELNEKSNQLASYLVASGLKREDLVALCVERSPEMMIGILAVLKAGGAYVAIEPKYPLARVQRIINNGNCKFVLSVSKLIGKRKLDELVEKCEAIDINSNIFSDQSSLNLEKNSLGLESKNLAYVIFTSGSTGEPKGVMVEHDSIVKFCEDIKERYYTEDLAGSLVATSFGFDLTLPSLFLPLLAGDHLRLLDDGDELRCLTEYLSQQTNKDDKPYFVRLTPSHMTALMQLFGDFESLCPHLFVIGGEPFPIITYQSFSSIFPNSRFYNQYGPAETVVACSLFEINREFPPSKHKFCPIGTALNHNHLLVLDTNLQPVPVGVIGELYVGGDGLARGYLNKVTLSAEKFIDNPFNDDIQSRMYKTGDLVRWLEDGNLEFVERIDNQVKVHGLRVELGEIEQALRSISDVSDCSVTIYETSEQDKKIVAYIVSKDTSKYHIDTAATNKTKLTNIKNYKDKLSKIIPEFMIPHLFVYVSSIPLTVNGKVDKKRLPRPTDKDLLTSIYVAPEFPLEHKLCNIVEQLLKVKQVGREDDFFALGGHSLLATKLVNDIRKEFSIEIPLKKIFEHSKICDLSACLEELESCNTMPSITKIEKGNALPMSFAQKRLWFIDQLGEGSTQYNMSGYFPLTGKFDLNAFRFALQTIIERHQVIRTVFDNLQGEARPRVIESFELPYLVHDFSKLSDDEKQVAVQNLIEKDAAKAFNLSQDLMVRLNLVIDDDQSQIVFYTMHHIAGDAWSTEIFRREFKLVYKSFIHGTEENLEPLRIQYVDYANWQNEWLQGEILDKQIDYWKKILKGMPLKHSVPLDKVRPANQTFKGRGIHQRLKCELTSQIRSICDKEQVTLFMFMQTAFAILLGRHSNESDIVMGSVVAGRTHSDVENLIGLFLNVLVLRTDVSSNKSFAQILSKNKKNILDAFENQAIPFELLVEELCPERSLSHNSIVQILFGVQNSEREAIYSPRSESSFEEGIVCSQQVVSTRFDLKLDVIEVDNTLLLSWVYNTALFEEYSVVKMIESYEVLLTKIVEQFCSRSKTYLNVAEIGLLDDKTRDMVIADWNHHDVSFPQESLLHNLFEKQVEQNPDAIALIYEDKEINYETLNQRANQLAHYLLEKGMKPDDLVALYLERSIDMVISMMAILKCGAAYVPLDPASPKSRLSYMLTDCRAKIVITQTSLYKDFSEDLTSGQYKLLCVDSSNIRERLLELSTFNLCVNSLGVSCDNLAYVIYTSGSTGTPKGVAVSHRNACDFLYHAVNDFLPSHVSGAIVSSPLIFDATVGSLHVPLCAGKFAELIPDGVFAIERLADCLADDEDSFLFKITPSHLEAIAAQELMSSNKIAKHVVVVAGEPLPTKSAKHWKNEILPSSLIINEYGPTEATVGATTLALDQDYQLSEHNNSVVPIGRALGDTRLYVLNEQLSLQSIGSIGELFIGGQGVARGYFNKASLTAQRFVPDPYSFEPGTRIYRTGDLVRYLPEEGQVAPILQFINRIDNQVKIRGNRVELGEIESVALKHESIREILIVARKSADNESRLVAYIVSDKSIVKNEGDQKVLTSMLKKDLDRKLPKYMVPDYYIHLECFPLTQNGKIDRENLPVPGEENLDKAIYVAPKNELETILCELWQELLGIEQVGITDNFFAIGGHSLLATRLVSLVRHKFEVELSLRVLFENPSVEDLAKEIMSLSFVKKSAENEQELDVSDDIEEVILE